MMEEQSTTLFPMRIAKSIVEHVKEDVKLLISNSKVINDEWEGKNSIFGLFEKKEIQLGKLIGSGGFSDVYEISEFSSSSSNQLFWSEQQRLDRKIMKRNAIHDGKSKYVVKHLKVKMTENTKTFCAAASDLVLEAQYLSSLNHENILKLRGWAATGIESYSDGGHNGYFLILDRLEDTLDSRLKSWRMKSDVSDSFGDLNARGEKSTNNNLLTRINVARQAASAVRYLHSKNIVFRDLKPNNIGFDRFGIVKIFDFGLARELPEKCVTGSKDEYRMTGLVGTLRYMAPEVALRKNYNQKADTYSWAMIFWSCLAFTKPYIKMNRSTYLMDVCRLGQRPALQDDWRGSIRSLLEKSWAQELCNRITMVEVCRDLKQIETELSTEFEFESSSPGNSQKKSDCFLPHQKPLFVRQKFLPRNIVVPFAA